MKNEESFLVKSVLWMRDEGLKTVTKAYGLTSQRSDNFFNFFTSEIKHMSALLHSCTPKKQSPPPLLKMKTKKSARITRTLL